MKTYNNINIIKDSNNNSYYDEPLIPTIPTNSDDIFYKSIPGDRLDILSKKFYNDMTLYMIIGRANNIVGTIFVEVGTILRIPSLNSVNLYLQNFKK
jgi:nucleoid-associated protein YgaU